MSEVEVSGNLGTDGVTDYARTRYVIGNKLVNNAYLQLVLGRENSDAGVETDIPVVAPEDGTDPVL